MGYVGFSRSERSQEDINNYIVPKSMINKNLLQDFFESHKFKGKHSQKDNDFIKSQNLKTWKKILEDYISPYSWHHTGKFFNKTDHYSLEEIVEFMLEHKHFLHKFIKGAKKFDGKDFSNDKQILIDHAFFYDNILDYASDELKKNKEFNLEFVKNNSFNYKLLLPEFRADVDIFKIAINDNPFLIEYAPIFFKNDRNLAEKLIEKNPFTLQFLPELSNDKSIVDLAISINGLSFKYATHILRSDPELTIKAIKNGFNRLDLLNEDLFSNKKVMLEVLKKDICNLGYCNNNLLDDEDIALYVVSQNGEFLKHFNKSIKENLNIVTAAIKNNPTAIQYAAIDIQNKLGYKDPWAQKLSNEKKGLTRD